MLAISHCHCLLSVSCCLLNYTNNNLNKPKLQKEQELLVNSVVKHYFWVTFTFYCANFRLSCKSEQSSIWVAYVTDRFVWQTFSDIPILSPFWQLQVYKRLGKKNKFSALAKEDILHDTTSEKLKLRRSDMLIARGHVGFVLLKSSFNEDFSMQLSSRRVQSTEISYFIYRFFGIQALFLLPG